MQRGFSSAILSVSRRASCARKRAFFVQTHSNVLNTFLSLAVRQWPIKSPLQLRHNIWCAFIAHEWLIIKRRQILLRSAVCCKEDTLLLAFIYTLGIAERMKIQQCAVHKWSRKASAERDLGQPTLNNKTLCTIPFSFSLSLLIAEKWRGEKRQSRVCWAIIYCRKKFCLNFRFLLWPCMKSG